MIKFYIYRFGRYFDNSKCWCRGNFFFVSGNISGVIILEGVFIKVREVYVWD